MVDEERLRRRLIAYVENAAALEQNVLLQLDSPIVNTPNAQLVRMFRRHKEETQRQQQRLHERRRALGAGRGSPRPG